MTNFWRKLKKPFSVLAPMEMVTDVVFREIIREIGRPDVFFTEFTNVEGLNSDGREKVLQSLKFTPKQTPIVAQIWGLNLDCYQKSAKLLREMGFSGIDINMGCPDKTVIKNGSCSGLIKNKDLAKKIIEATRKGAGDLPVSVKTRLGFETPDMGWIEFLLRQELPVLTIHLRTVYEMSKVDAHWEYIHEIISLRDKISPQTIIIGNGDIKSVEDIKAKYNKYHNEGFMAGTGIFSNPWIFNPKVNIEDVRVKEKLGLYLKHIKLFQKTWGKAKNPAIIKKFCKMYIQGFPGASELRAELMKENSLDQFQEILKIYKINQKLPCLIR